MKKINSIIALAFAVLFAGLLSTSTSMPVDGETYLQAVNQQVANWPAGTKGFTQHKADGGNDIEQATLLVQDKAGVESEMVAYEDQPFLADPNQNYRPQYILTKNGWMKVVKVKEYGGTGCGKIASSETIISKPEVVKVDPEPVEPATVAACDPVIQEECIDPGSNKIYKGNPHKSKIHIVVIPVATAGDNPTGKTYPRDIITINDFVANNSSNGL